MPTYNIELLEQVRDIIAEESKHNQASWAEVSRQVAEQAALSCGIVRKPLPCRWVLAGFKVLLPGIDNCRAKPKLM